jgi:hypothetical protein
MRTKIEVEVDVSLGAEGITIELVGTGQGGEKLFIPTVGAVTDHIAQLRQPDGSIRQEDLHELRAMMETARICALTLEATLSHQAKAGNALDQSDCPEKLLKRLQAAGVAG